MADDNTASAMDERKDGDVPIPPPPKPMSYDEWKVVFKGTVEGNVGICQSLYARNDALVECFAGVRCHDKEKSRTLLRRLCELAVSIKVLDRAVPKGSVCPITGDTKKKNLRRVIVVGQSKDVGECVEYELGVFSINVMGCLTAIVLIGNIRSFICASYALNKNTIVPEESKLMFDQYSAAYHVILY
jgi:hypothetical protein